MKIFFDHKIFVNQNYGGPSRYITSLVDQLNNNKNINARIFAPFHINNYLSKLHQKKINPSFKLPFSDQINKFYKVKKKLMLANGLINKYIFKKFNPDILHTTYYDDDFFPNNKKIVLTVHDLIHEIFRADYGFKKSYLPKRKMIDRADHIICVSESTKIDLINYYNVPDNKITVIYHSSPFENDEKQTYKMDINILNEKYFLYVGSRWKYKNFSNLLKTLKFNTSILKNYKLVLFGGGRITNSEINQIKKLDLNIDNIIHFSGNEKLLKNLYRHAEFLIYPSKYEGFGIPVLESFSQECPVICSNTSSLPEVAGDAALYFDPNDVSSISDSITKITSSEEIKRIYIQKGLKRLQSFSWEKCANETINVYNNLLY